MEQIYFMPQATIWHRQALQSFCRDIQICPSGHYLASPGPAEFLQGYTNLSLWPLFVIARPCRVSAGIYKFVPLCHYLALPGPAKFLQRCTNLSLWPVFGIARPCRVSAGIYKFVPLATIWHCQSLQSFCRDIQICPSGQYLASPGPAEFLQGYTNLSLWPLFVIARPCRVSAGIYKFVPLCHYLALPGPAKFLQRCTNLSLWPVFGIARPCRVSAGIYKFVPLATIWHCQSLQSFCRDIQICPSGHYSASPGPAEFLQGYTNLSLWPVFGIARPCRVSAGIYKFVPLATIWHAHRGLEKLMGCMVPPRKAAY